MQHVVAGESDGVEDAPLLQVLIDLRFGGGGIGPEVPAHFVKLSSVKGLGHPEGRTIEQGARMRGPLAFLGGVDDGGGVARDEMHPQAGAERNAEIVKRKERGLADSWVGNAVVDLVGDRLCLSGRRKPLLSETTASASFSALRLQTAQACSTAYGRRTSTSGALHAPASTASGCS